MLVSELEYAMEVEDFDDNTLLLFVSSDDTACERLLESVSEMEDDQEPYCHIVDVDAFVGMVISLDVTSIPAVMYLNRGRVVEKASGEAGCYDLLQEALKGHLGD